MAALNEKKTCSQRMENFQRFVWNPDTGQLMGRTLINWDYQLSAGKWHRTNRTKSELHNS
ncbi:hypothetical protein lerEdw1_016535, partial [Lerista edwardsae]